MGIKLSKVPKMEKMEIDINAVANEYEVLRSQKSAVEARMKKLSETIKEYAESNGVKNSSGSFVYESPDFYIEKQAKKSVNFKTEEAIKFLESKKLKDCIVVTKSLNTDVISKHVDSGDLSVEDIEGITETKVTYAVSVKKRTELPSIETSTVAVAASRKTKGK